MKKLSFIIVFVFLSILFVQAQQAKYVFYFIGDGMGVNQVLGTEMYPWRVGRQNGVTPLLFTQFPYATIATTFLGNQRSDRFGPLQEQHLLRETKQKWRIRCEKDLEPKLTVLLLGQKIKVAV